MSKGMPILGIVSAVLAALLVGNVTGPFVPFLVMAVLLATAVMLFMRGGRTHMLIGVGVVALALLPLLYFTPVVGKNGNIFPDAGKFWQIQAQPILALIPAVLVLTGRRAQVTPPWLVYASYAAAALVALMAILISPNDYGGVGLYGIIGAVLSLYLVWPMLVIMRAGPAPTMTESMSEPAQAPDTTAATPPAKPKARAPTKRAAKK